MRIERISSSKSGVEIENNKVKLMINMFGTETQAELELYQIAEL